MHTNQNHRGVICVHLCESVAQNAFFLPSRLVRTVVAAAFVAGLLLSRRLWLSERVYPLTPVASFLRPVPFPWDWAFYLALLVSLVIVAIAPRPRIPLVVFAAIVAVAAAFDQSRWQPWAYQYAIMLLTFAAADERTPLAVARTAVAFTYLWSGLQKLNPDFAPGTFQWMVEPFVAHWTGTLQRMEYASGYVAPYVEVAIGIALLMGKLRRPAVIAAIVMHAFILLCIGPLGRSANTVVWPWNLTMIVLLILLFWNGGSVVGRGPCYWVAVACFGILPALSFVDCWDSYLSMSLYSGNQYRGTIHLTDEVFDRLPTALADQCYEDEPGWNTIDVNLWSFVELNAPAYAEPRVLRNVARVVCAYARKPGEVKLEISPKHALLNQETKKFLTCDQLR